MKLTANTQVFVRKFDGVERTTLGTAFERQVVCWTTPEEVWDELIAEWDDKASSAKAQADKIRSAAAAAGG